MAWGFRRSMKIAPGLRLNVGKKGFSVRAGGRGFGVTSGTSGTSVSGGIPGTGLHARSKLSGRSKEAQSPVEPIEPIEPVEPTRGATTLGFVVIIVGIGILTYLLA